LAEDNVVNQRVAVRTLEKRGHKVVVVGTGREAVAAAKEQSFDAILMDVQMPEMDGFEATAAIRQHEQGTGRHIRIIAMTAHAMKGDRERCLEAGMDGYVAKPLQPEALFAAIEKTDAAASPPEEAPFDLEDVLKQFGDDRELLQEVVGVFLEACPGWQADIKAAIAAGDAAKLKLAAHTLKGAVSHFGAEPAYQAAHRLEQMATAGTLAEAPAAYTALEQALVHLQAALRQACGNQSTAEAPTRDTIV
jgi:CheY-like chemotaxis protein